MGGHLSVLRWILRSGVLPAPHLTSVVFPGDAKLDNSLKMLKLDQYAEELRSQAGITDFSDFAQTTADDVESLATMDSASKARLLNFLSGVHDLRKCTVSCT